MEVAVGEMSCSIITLLVSHNHSRNVEVIPEDLLQINERLSPSALILLTPGSVTAKSLLVSQWTTALPPPPGPV